MTHPLDPKALEAAARALCLKAGNEPDLMRGDGIENWTYYRPHTIAAISAYLDATGDGWRPIETAPTGPGTMIEVRPSIKFEMHRVDAYPTTLPGAIQHNAYWDAMALRHKLTQDQQ